MTHQESELLRGGVNTVERVGARVHRPAAPWNAVVHALLRHLDAAGFGAAPRAHGFDAQGREVLDFLPGTIGENPHDLSTATLTSVGALLRDYHDATAAFAPTAPGGWQLPSRAPAEVICHGDMAPYNTVFDGERATGFIDFDTAHPGPRSWDLGYALYRFAPLTDPDGPEGGSTPAEQAARARALLDGYRAAPALRAQALAQVAPRLQALVDFMTERAADGDAAFAGHLAAGHAAVYLRDIAYVQAHREQWERIILR